MIRSYPEKTRERVQQLEDYMCTHVLSGDAFLCRSFHECRASKSDFPFYDGQLSHVGRHYDLEIDGRPTRIVIVGQEYGHGPGRVDLDVRSKMILGLASGGFRGRNPHMRGTTSMLRLLLGRDLGTDLEGERLLDGHIFDGFALVNYLLCTALKEQRDQYDGGAGKGFSSSTMRRNCGGHFLRTLEILQPTIIMVQGQGVRQWLAGALGLPKSGPVAEQVQIRDTTVDMLVFDHPSAGGRSGFWGKSPNTCYLREVVEPTIRSLRARLADGGRAAL